MSTVENDKWFFKQRWHRHKTRCTGAAGNCALQSSRPSVTTQLFRKSLLQCTLINRLEHFWRRARFSRISAAAWSAAFLLAIVACLVDLRNCIFLTTFVLLHFSRKLTRVYIPLGYSRYQHLADTGNQSDHSCLIEWGQSPAGPFIHKSDSADQIKRLIKSSAMIGYATGRYHPIAVISIPSTANLVALLLTLTIAEEFVQALTWAKLGDVFMFDGTFGVYLIASFGWPPM